MQDFFRKALENNYASEIPFVVYAHSGSIELTGLFQKEKMACSFSPGDKGFIFAPFSSEEDTLFIPLNKSDLLATELSHPEPKEAVDNIVLDSGQEPSHIALVAKAVETISATEMEKVVISRKQEISLSHFNMWRLLESLFTSDIKVFRYLWYHPDSGLWIGATPEVLLTLSNGKYRTMSLAGTRLATTGEQREWTRKEYHEQGLVTETIAKQLVPISESVEVSEVGTVRAGNLEHLRTDFEGVLKPGFHWLQLTRMLHPTPAVCGSPRENALDFILKNEGYDRRYYTGYLGAVEISGSNTDLLVNLRCMSLEGNSATIYSGGGITQDSDPNAEWDETCNKQQTMLKVLREFL